MNIQYKFLNELTDDERKIRTAVFIEEQGLTPECEFDDIDAHSDHIIIYVDDNPAACCRYFCDNDEYRIGRVAVLEDYRGLGLGEMLMDAAEDMIFSNGGTKAVVHAQVRVKGFYKKCRYKETGEPFKEDGIRHIIMEKVLTNNTLL